MDDVRLTVGEVLLFVYVTAAEDVYDEEKEEEEEVVMILLN